MNLEYLEVDGCRIIIDKEARIEVADDYYDNLKDTDCKINQGKDAARNNRLSDFQNADTGLPRFHKIIYISKVL